MGKVQITQGFTIQGTGPGEKFQVLINENERAACETQQLLLKNKIETSLRKGERYFVDAHELFAAFSYVLGFADDRNMMYEELKATRLYNYFILGQLSEWADDITNGSFKMQPGPNGVAIVPGDEPLSNAITAPPMAYISREFWPNE